MQKSEYKYYNDIIVTKSILTGNDNGEKLQTENKVNQKFSKHLHCYTFCSSELSIRQRILPKKKHSIFLFFTLIGSNKCSRGEHKRLQILPTSVASVKSISPKAEIT